MGCVIAILSRYKYINTHTHKDVLPIQTVEYSTLSKHHSGCLSETDTH